MTTPPVMAAAKWKSNAELVEIVATRLGPDGTGYLKATDRILDPTWGDGKWWTRWRPNNCMLVGHDLYKLDGVDFRKLPHIDACFDAAVWDPAYAPQGGRKTSTIKKTLAAYGRDTAPRTPEALHEMNSDGFRELLRVVKPESIILAKAMNYVWSGTFHPAALDFAVFAQGLGCSIEEMFIHYGSGSPQKKDRTRKATKKELAAGLPERIPSVQQHARNNFSVMYVLRTPKLEEPE